MALLDMPDVTLRMMTARARLLERIIAHVGYPRNEELGQSYYTQADIHWLYEHGCIDLWGPDWKTCLVVPTEAGRAWLKTFKERALDGG